MRSLEPLPTDHDAAARLARDLGVHAITAQILTCRGLSDPDDARRFLRPGPDQLHDPFLFRDMRKAVETTVDALKAGRRIAVYGDYDVDGVTATTVLLRTLRVLGADAIAFIPDRLREGYGLNAAALMRLHGEGAGLVITVDNGTSRPDEIAAARAGGLDIVVTDHHEQGETLPDCPVINPKRRDTRYPFPGLAGCGVAFKFATALAEETGRAQTDAFKKLLPDLLALVAIGTVADVVPLVNENRSLVALGLKALQGTRHAGLRALIKVARCAGRPLRPSDIGFRLGPRINAAGRLGSASLALNLLLCEEEETAAELAKRLDDGNRERQKVERAQWGEAEERGREILSKSPLPALVMGDPGWHPGVIGIVAARATETFHVPAAMIAIEGDTARGSARSFGHIRLHEALAECAEHLLTHGGHAAAAGFTLKTRDIERFTEAFLAAVALQGPTPDVPTQVDAELPIDAISTPLAAELELLGPFGSGNREPLFCAYDVRAAGRTRRIGQEDRHLSFYAASDRNSVRAVAFNQGEQEDLLAQRFDLAFVLRRREGSDPVEIIVREIVPA